ncbi:MAG: hypothetical protein U9Q03_00955 [Patescibacteria group bacterium]|nr:hypothetical protein [Patescibacteria group bacterium]
MVAGSDTSRCGTVQGSLRTAQALKMRFIEDIAVAIRPLVAEVVVPKVKKGLAESSRLSDSVILDAFWRNVNDAELDAMDRAAIELLMLPRELDPEERRQIALGVVKDESRKLVSVWLQKLMALTCSGYVSTVQAIDSGSLPSGHDIRHGDCDGFEVLSAYEANRILGRIAKLPNAGAIFAMVNVYLVL